jgi:predicted adenylyl cyclase CyaB
MHLNIEIKARCERQAALRDLLAARGARFIGEDHQVDTYFRVPRGRLKLREGTLERALIYYERDDATEPRASRVSLYPAPGGPLKDLLVRAFGVLVAVEKRREIYFIENVKFHLDRVEGLGAFVEIEAIDAEGTLGEAHLRRQCAAYLALFDLPPEAMVGGSYSDMLLNEASASGQPPPGPAGP